MENNLDDIAVINSELRYLTIELMKIAAQSGISFDDAVDDYIANTHKLKKLFLETPTVYSLKGKAPFGTRSLKR